MIRNAYRNYFKDEDLSIPSYKDFWKINIIEEIKETKTAYSTELQQGEALKYLVLSEKRFITNSIINNKPKALKVDLPEMYIVRLTKYDTTGIEKNVLDDFSKVFLDIKKGKNFSNGNVLNGSAKQMICGMFNECELSHGIKATGEINLRNIVNVKGECKEIPPESGQFVCPNLFLYANYDNEIIANTTIDQGAAIVAGANNFIKAEENILSEPIYFKANNVIIEPNFDIASGLYLMPHYPQLAFNTIITSDGKAGDNFIEVKSTDFVLNGIKLMYLSNESGLVFKRVVGVQDNKILVDEPIKEKELPIKNGICFAEPPIENDEIDFKVEKPIKKFSRIAYVETKSIDISLLGKRAFIYKGNTLLAKNKINFYSDLKGLIIFNKSFSDKLEADKIVVESFKFVGPMKFKINSELPNIYIGQKVQVGDKSYTVNGFNSKDKSISFSEIDASTLKNQAATTDKVPDSYYNSPETFFKKLKVIKGKKYLDIIQVEKTDGLQKGAIIKYKDSYIPINEISINKNTANIKLSASFLPNVLENKIVYKDYIGDIDPYIDTDELKTKLGNIKRNDK